MKVRLGNISNSSSSSFILVVKNKDVTVQDALSTMKVEADNPFAMIGNDAIDFLASSMKKMDKLHLEEIVEEDYCGDVAKYAKDGLRVHECSACTDGGDDIEALLAEMEMEIDNDDLYLWSEGR